MLPALTSDMNWFVSFGINERYHQIQRGDIVKIRRSEAPLVGTLKPGRVIALKGDYVDSPGRDQDNDNDCVDHDPFSCVPKSHCWVGGNNYDNSCDSKFYGPLRLALVFGNLQALVPPERGRALHRMDKALQSRIHKGKISLEITHGSS